MLRFFVCVVFLYWDKIKNTKNYECDDLGNPIHCKNTQFVSAT